MFQIFNASDSPAALRFVFGKRFLAFAFFIFLCLLIVLMNSGIDFHVLQSIRRIPSADKVGHIAMYGLLALFVNMAWGFAHFDLAIRWIRGQYFQLGSFAVLFFSLFEEFSQQFFPTRTIDAWDALANLVGVVIFTIVSGRMAQSKRSRPIQVLAIAQTKSSLTNEPTSN